MKLTKRLPRLLALVLLVAMVLTVSALAYNIEPAEGIVIDGVVTEEEWGQPSESYWVSRGYDSENDEFVTWEYMPGYEPEGAWEAYFKYDADYLYFAMTCHNIKPGNELTADQLAEAHLTDYWKKACAWIGIAMYDDVMANPQTKDFGAGEETRNVWTKLYFSLLDDGTEGFHHDIVKGYWGHEQATAGFTTLTPEDYAITWSEPDLTYEARIPWSMITDQETVEAGDAIVTSVVCKMAHQPGTESGNTMMWGMGVCIDDLMAGGVPGKLVAPKEEEPVEEPVEEEPVEEEPEAPAEEPEAPAEEPVEEAPAEEPVEEEKPASTKNIILYVILGVLGVGIIAVVVLLLKGGKKEEKK